MTADDRPDEGARVPRGGRGLRIRGVRRPSRPTIGLVLGPSLALLAYLVMPDVVPPDAAVDTSHRAAATTAAVLVLMGVWWMTEALPLPVTALVPIVAFPVVAGVEVSAIAAPYANKVVFLFFGGFVLAIAMQRWQLHLRIALGVVRLVGTKSSRLVLGFMVATAFLSMWVSNTATAVMMLPIGMSVLTLLNRKKGSVDAKLSTSLMLGIAYAATIGGLDP